MRFSSQFQCPPVLAKMLEVHFFHHLPPPPNPPETHHNVAFRPVAGQRQQDKQKYNSHYWVTASKTSTFEWQQLEIATEEQCFLCGLCRDVISSKAAAMSYLWDSCQLVKTWARKQGTLLGSVTRQWLVKAQQTQKT
jgi:ferredoxin-like protein FixX